MAARIFWIGVTGVEGPFTPGELGVPVLPRSRCAKGDPVLPRRQPGDPGDGPDATGVPPITAGPESLLARPLSSAVFLGEPDSVLGDSELSLLVESVFTGFGLRSWKAGDPAAGVCGLAVRLRDPELGVPRGCCCWILLLLLLGAGWSSSIENTTFPFTLSSVLIPGETGSVEAPTPPSR